MSFSSRGIHIHILYETIPKYTYFPAYYHNDIVLQKLSQVHDSSKEYRNASRNSSYKSLILSKKRLGFNLQVRVATKAF